MPKRVYRGNVPRKVPMYDDAGALTFRLVVPDQELDLSDAEAARFDRDAPDLFMPPGERPEAPRRRGGQVW